MVDGKARASAVLSIQKATRVLDVVAEQAVRGASLGDVVAATGMNRATAHRILKTLVETGLVDQDGGRVLYFPGIKLVGIAATAANRFGLAQSSQSGRARIAERTADTVFLTIRVGDEAVCVARTEGSFPIKTLTLNVGDKRPLGVGAGSLAILSFLDPSNADTILATHAAALEPYGVSVADVRHEMERARKLGYALDEGRIIPGTTGLGSPIRAGGGDVAAALSVAAISDRMRGARRANVVRWLSEECERLEADLQPILSARAAGSRSLILGGG